jgi:oxygen-independent coproporphyrinogen-3 oxidase
MSTCLPPLDKGIDLAGISAALGALPGVSYAAAHVYPAAAPAYGRRSWATRERPDGKTLRLYVHIPFCNYACSFCFYATRAGAGRELMERYTRAVVKELEWIEPGSVLSQLFVGGGTPTALPPELLDLVVRSVFERLQRTAGIVHTVEASPESVTAGHVGVLQANGIERVSMGVQSLDHGVLAGVHRRHTAEQSMQACRLLVDSGLAVNVDLMYGLPRQSPESFLHDLRTVAGWGAHSVTLYSLRLNERTSVSKKLGSDERLDLELLLRWRTFVSRSAAELGFVQTRWHTFKRLDGPMAKHERLQTFDKRMHGNQLGVGNSSRSHLRYTIYRNHCDLKTYVDRIERGQSPVEDIFPLLDEDIKTQFIARSLGDGKQLSKDLYEECFESRIEDDFAPTLERLIATGLVVDEKGHLSMTDTGKLLHDLIAIAFYPAHAKNWLATRQAG